jgi:quercetin dioxygenase-like cupin family protein
MKLYRPAAWAFVLLLCAGAASAQQEPKIKVTPLLETVTTLTGQKLEYPKNNPQVKVTMAELPPGAAVGWHEHPNLRYVYVLDGTLTIEMEDGTRREFPAGTIFVEALRTRHRGVNAGATPVKVLFIDHAEAGQSNMILSEPPGDRHPAGAREH